MRNLVIMVMVVLRRQWKRKGRTMVAACIAWRGLRRVGRRGRDGLTLVSRRDTRDQGRAWPEVLLVKGQELNLGL